MKKLRKLSSLSLIPVSFILLFALATPAKADSTTEYNQKVDAAKAKISDLENQLANAQANLESWTGSSNNQANLINEAQTIATEAKDALEVAANNYAEKKAAYDAAYAHEQASEAAVINAGNELNIADDNLAQAYSDWVNAQSVSDAADAALAQAQINYDTQLINVGGQGGTSAGLTVDVYTGINRNGNPPSRSDTAYTKCKTTTLSNIDVNWGGGDILGCGSEYVMLHYHGYITYPTTKQVYFQNQADDGFFMTINGQTVINDWSLKGCSANSTGLFSFTAGKSYKIDAWFYEWTGGACSTLYYAPLGGSWNVAPASFFTQDAVATLVKNPALLVVLNQKRNEYVQAVAAEEQANQIYLDKENVYESAFLTYVALNQSLSIELSELQAFEQVLNGFESDWQNASDDRAVADANLLDLKNEYSTTFDAIAAAASLVETLEAQLAQAKVDLANIPKPTAAPARKNKKTTTRAYAGEAYRPKAAFVPIPK
jgi:hypothetical protein